MIIFFQAEDGIRDGHVTGVQTCALPILLKGKTKEEAKQLIDIFLKMIKREKVDEEELEKIEDARALQNISNMPARVKCAEQIGRASCREREEMTERAEEGEENR